MSLNVSRDRVTLWLPTPAATRSSGTTAARRPAAWALIAALSLASGGILGVALATSAARGVTRILDPVPMSPAEAVTTLCALAALALVAYLTLTVALTATAHLPGRLGRLGAWVLARTTPALAQRWAAVLLGATVSGVAVPGPALASGSPAPVEPVPVSAVAFVPTGEATPLVEAGQASAELDPGPGWTPTRPIRRPVSAPHLLGAVPSDAADTASASHVVLRGDTLWAIAARHLGPDACDAQISQEWRRWYAVNRDLIGPDPDLILPGQVLRPPTSVTAP